MFKRVAVVHDFCFQYGGGEKVVEKFLEMYPEADLYTSIFVPSKFASSQVFTAIYNSDKIKTTWLNGIFNWNKGYLLRYFKHFFWLYPLVMRSVTLRDYDLVLISSTDCGKQIRFNNSPKILHYCHTPTRYLHGLVDTENYKIGFVQKFLLPFFVFFLRPMDLKAMEYLNSKKCIWVANSIFVQGLIADIYKTDSTVIYPPIEVEKFLGILRLNHTYKSEEILKQVQDDGDFLNNEKNTPFEGVKPKVSGLLSSTLDLRFAQDNSLVEGGNTPVKGSNEVRGLFNGNNEGILYSTQDDFTAMEKNTSFEGVKPKVSGLLNSTVKSKDILKQVQDDDMVEVSLNNKFCVESKPFYLCHGRISFHKRIDLAMRACLELGVRLKISGTSALLQEMQDLQKIIDDFELEFPAKNGLVELLGRTTDEQINGLISNCKAFIFPGKEDFGIAPVEMLAAGVPLIAYQSGGALEYVKDGENGVFFTQQTVESLVKAIQEFEKVKGRNESKIRESSKSFDQKVFVKKIRSLLN